MLEIYKKLLNLYICVQKDFQISFLTTIKEELEKSAE